MSRSSREYLQHILDETHYLSNQAQRLNKETFLQDETLKRAFVRSLEIIGEAVKHIPDDLLQQHSQIEWRAIARMRDRLIHGYFGVDYELVWDVIQTKIPALQYEITTMLARSADAGAPPNV